VLKDLRRRLTAIERFFKVVFKNNGRSLKLLLGQGFKAKQNCPAV